MYTYLFFFFQRCHHKLFLTVNNICLWLIIILFFSSIIVINNLIYLKFIVCHSIRLLNCLDQIRYTEYFFKLILQFIRCYIICNCQILINFQVPTKAQNTRKTGRAFYSLFSDNRNIIYLPLNNTFLTQTIF